LETHQVFGAFFCLFVYLE